MSAGHAARLLVLGLLVTFLLAPQWFAPVFAPLNEFGAPAIYDQGNLLSLALWHVVTVIAAAFAGKRSLQRHQLVYGTLGSRVGREIHALALETLTPEEWQARSPAS